MNTAEYLVDILSSMIIITIGFLCLCILVAWLAGDSNGPHDGPNSGGTGMGW